MKCECLFSYDMKSCKLMSFYKALLNILTSDKFYTFSSNVYQHPCCPRPAKTM